MSESRRRWTTGLSMLAAVGLTAAATPALGSPAAQPPDAQPITHPTKAPAAQPDIRSILTGVSAVSASDAFAVGYRGIPQSEHLLIEQWDGTQWTRAHGLSRGYLYGVSAESPTDANAVGEDGSKTVAMHWDGASWQRVPSANPSRTHSTLYDVATVSSTLAWAVGTMNDGADNHTLVERWDGTAWTRYWSPSVPHSVSYLESVSVVSPSDIWAVGFALKNGQQKTLVLHFDGVHWTKVPSPNPGPHVNVLLGVTAVSANDVWAVGGRASPLGKRRTLVEHWNGTAWTTGHTPNPGNHNVVLTDVSATSGKDIWAVGTNTDQGRTFVLHFDGNHWSWVTSANHPGGFDDALHGVSAVSPTLAFAVGSYRRSGSLEIELIQHWNGSVWE